MKLQIFFFLSLVVSNPLAMFFALCLLCRIRVARGCTRSFVSLCCLVLKLVQGLPPYNRGYNLIFQRAYRGGLIFDTPGAIPKPTVVPHTLAPAGGGGWNTGIDVPRVSKKARRDKQQQQQQPPQKHGPTDGGGGDKKSSKKKNKKGSKKSAPGTGDDVKQEGVEGAAAAVGGPSAPSAGAGSARKPATETGDAGVSAGERRTSRRTVLGDAGRKHNSVSGEETSRAGPERETRKRGVSSSSPPSSSYVVAWLEGEARKLGWPPAGVQPDGISRTMIEDLPVDPESSVVEPPLPPSSSSGAVAAASAPATATPGGGGAGGHDSDGAPSRPRQKEEKPPVRSSPTAASEPRGKEGEASREVEEAAKGDDKAGGQRETRKRGSATAVAGGRRGSRGGGAVSPALKRVASRKDSAGQGQEDSGRSSDGGRLAGQGAVSSSQADAGADAGADDKHVHGCVGLDPPENSAAPMKSRCREKRGAGDDVGAPKVAAAASAAATAAAVLKPDQEREEEGRQQQQPLCTPSRRGSLSPPLPTGDAVDSTTTAASRTKGKSPARLKHMAKKKSAFPTKGGGDGASGKRKGRGETPRRSSIPLSPTQAVFQMPSDDEEEEEEAAACATAIKQRHQLSFAKRTAAVGSTPPAPAPPATAPSSRPQPVLSSSIKKKKKKSDDGGGSDISLAGKAAPVGGSKARPTKGNGHAAARAAPGAGGESEARVGAAGGVISKRGRDGKDGVGVGRDAPAGVASAAAVVPQPSGRKQRATVSFAWVRGVGVLPEAVGRRERSCSVARCSACDVPRRHLCCTSSSWFFGVAPLSLYPGVLVGTPLTCVTLPVQPAAIFRRRHPQRLFRPMWQQLA